MGRRDRRRTMLKSALILMLALQGVRAKISSGESILSCELRDEDIFSGITWTSINPEDTEKLSPPTGFYTGSDGKQKYQEAIIDCEKPINRNQPWCTASGSGWRKTDLNPIKLFASSVLPPILDYRWEGIKQETTSMNDSMKRFSVIKNSVITELSVMGNGPMVVDTEIRLETSKRTLFWRLVLDEIQNGKTYSAIFVCTNFGNNCTSVAERQVTILDPARWMHLRFGFFDQPSIIFVDAANEKFMKSTWLSTKYDEVNLPSYSIFSFYTIKQEIYFQDTMSFRKIKQPDDTLAYITEYRNKTLHIRNALGRCWQILYYGAFELHERYGNSTQKLEQKSKDDWSVVQVQLNSTNDIYLTSKDWKQRGKNNLVNIWILGDIRECFGDMRVSKLVIPAGVNAEDIRCTTIKNGNTFSFTAYSRSLPPTSTVVVSSDTWLYVSMAILAIFLGTLIVLGLMLWNHPFRCCVRSAGLVRLEMRNPNVIPSTRYVTSNCQNSAMVDEVVYDEIVMSKNPGPSCKSDDVSNGLCHNITPKPKSLELEDDVVYEEIKITTNPGSSSKSSSVYYSNQKTKKDRPESSVYNNVNSENDSLYVN